MNEQSTKLNKQATKMNEQSTKASEQVIRSDKSEEASELQSNNERWNNSQQTRGEGGRAK